MSNNRFSARQLRSSSIKLALLGSFTVAALVACSDDPPASNPIIPPGGTSGSSGAASGGTTGTAGTFGTAGTGTSGTGTAGTFGTAGTPATGGAGGAGTGGTAGTGTAGTGGTGVIVPQDPFCMGKTLEPLPYQVTTGFKQAGWDAGAGTQFTSGAQITPNPPANCTERVPGALGDCSVWRYTPAAVAPTYASVSWILQWDAGYKHPPVCVAEGATKIIFHAKGTAGGEKVFFGAPGVAEDVEVTLTTAWERYEIPVGVYNTFDAGVTKGFAIKVVPAEPPVVVEFYVDNILLVKDVPPDGGEGGAGNGGAGGAN